MIYYHVQQFKKEKEPMTIIVGLVATDGVVIAADSQAEMFRGTDVKRSDYTKIYSLGENEDKVKAIIAGAGSVAFINKAVNELRKKWGEKRFNGVADIEDAIESAMVALAKKYFFDRRRIFGVSEDQEISKSLHPKRHQQGPAPIPEVSLLVGACDETGNKMLATIGPEGIAELDETYTSVGSGSAYAEYILARLYGENLNSEQALECAIYTIEEVKKVDPNCGGPVRAIKVKKDGIENCDPDDLRSLVNKLEIRDELLGEMWRAMILGHKSSQDVKKFLGS